MSISTKSTFEDFSQDAWRSQFLQKILIMSAIVGLFALIPIAITTPELIFQSVYIGVYVLLVAIILIRMPYLVKATIFVLLPLILGISNLTQTGIKGDSFFPFLVFITFSALLMGSRAGVASIVITELIIGSLGYLVLSDHLALRAGSALEGEMWDWISAAVSQLLISIVIVSATRMLHEALQESHQRAIVMQQSQFKAQKELEDRIAERTQELSNRTSILNAALTVTHQISLMKDMEKLLDQAVILLTENFGCYHAGIYLINQHEDYLTLQAASSEGGKRLLEKGYRVRVGIEGMIGFVAAEKKPRVSPDVNMENVFVENPDLTGTKSELTLPLMIHNKVIGVLDLQSSNRNTFRYDEIDIFQAVADQIAVAIENTRKLDESQSVITQLEAISNKNTRQNWKTELSVRKPVFHFSARGVHPIEKPVAPKGKNVLDIPIQLRGEKIGCISLHRKDEFQKWSTREAAIASEVAAQAALALENLRLVEHTRERASREQAISNISARIRETLDLDIVLRTSAREIQKALSLQEAEIRLIPQDNRGSEEKQTETAF